ncbi:hypothetical protein [Allomuricauda sp.]|uniref:hypothetical protein n=1 Tax=Flagellimonas alginolytica TaxID=3177515 RepID=UPI0026003568|nr:hypothetical protein [Allomuricauda sp.]
MELQIENIESQIRDVIEEINVEQELNAKVTVNTCPYEIGISSQVLVSVMGLLEAKLEVEIPANCYIFYDKTKNKQLSIKEAALKLLKTIKK